MKSRKLARLVDEYLHVKWPKEEHALNYYRELSIPTAIEMAGLALGRENKKQSHQFRRTDGTLREWRRVLLKERNKLAKCREFSDLFEIISQLSTNVWGIGELTVYDTALRIGVRLDLKPELVYLHAGARQGAVKLGIGRTERYVSRSRFPPELQVLTPLQVENFLCVFKASFT